MAEHQISNDKGKVEEAARISRSLATFEKSLKEKCVDCIFKNAKVLHETDATKQQFSRLSPAIRNDLIKWLEFLVDTKKHCNSMDPGPNFVVIRPDLGYPSYDQTDENLERVYSLVQLLLNDFIIEFDFKVYENSRDCFWQTLQILTERCSNLKIIKDSLCLCPTCFEIESIVPNLLSLRCLEHIMLKCYTPTREDLEHLIEAFPNLRSFAANFSRRHFERSVLENLVKLKKLEVLCIRVVMPDYIECFFSVEPLSLEDALADCLRLLPMLEVADIFQNDGISDLFAHHNKNFEPEQPLALKSLRIDLDRRLRGKKWFSYMVPHVTKLYLRGHVWLTIGDVNEYLHFRYLTVLHFGSMPGDVIMEFLRIYHTNLEELKIRYCSAKPYELFSLCSNLNTLDWSGQAIPEESPNLHPVTAGNLRHLKNLNLDVNQFPSALLNEILKAPRLESVTLSAKIKLQADKLQEIQFLLQERKILQHLMQMKICLRDVKEDEQELYENFFGILLAYAPRLRDFRTDNARIFEFLKGLQISGLQFKIKMGSLSRNSYCDYSVCNGPEPESDLESSEDSSDW